jgi:hypothetical protein
VCSSVAAIARILFAMLPLLGSGVARSKFGFLSFRRSNVTSGGNIAFDIAHNSRCRVVQQGTGLHRFFFYMSHKWEISCMGICWWSRSFSRDFSQELRMSLRSRIDRFVMFMDHVRRILVLWLRSHKQSCRFVGLDLKPGGFGPARPSAPGILDNSVN